jgi:hypothetical protein
MYDLKEINNKSGKSYKEGFLHFNDKRIDVHLQSPSIKPVEVPYLKA